ncbi:MAG: hypothetical protein HND58_09985 [Planctomycetota bacterium]|nr:MAG: hypothetical protein HND58_09985 [Planctomycetota bacterium]
MSTLIAIADAVTASLNAGSFGQPFNAERLYQPAFELADLADLKVSVVPKGVTIATASRDGSYFDCAVDVGIQKKIADDAEIDGLVDLAEEIADHLRMKRLDDEPEAVWLSIEHEPVVAAEHLEQQRALTSILTVTYRVRR